MKRIHGPNAQSELDRSEPGDVFVIVGSVTGPLVVRTPGITLAGGRVVSNKRPAIAVLAAGIRLVDLDVVVEDASAARPTESVFMHLADAVLEGCTVSGGPLLATGGAPRIALCHLESLEVHGSDALEVTETIVSGAAMFVAVDDLRVSASTFGHVLLDRTGGSMEACVVRSGFIDPSAHGNRTVLRDVVTDVTRTSTRAPCDIARGMEVSPGGAQAALDAGVREIVLLPGLHEGRIVVSGDARVSARPEAVMAGPVWVSGSAILEGVHVRGELVMDGMSTANACSLCDVTIAGGAPTVCACSMRVLQVGGWSESRVIGCAIEGVILGQAGGVLERNVVRWNIDPGVGPNATRLVENEVLDLDGT